MHRSDALAPQADWRTPPREPKKRQKLEYGTYIHITCPIGVARTDLSSIE